MSLKRYSGYSGSRSNDAYIERARSGRHDAIPPGKEEIAFCRVTCVPRRFLNDTRGNERRNFQFNLFKRTLLPYLRRAIFTYVYFLPQLARARTFATRNTSAFERRLRVILRETYLHYRTSYQVKLGFASNGIVVSTVLALTTFCSCPLFLFPSSLCIFTLAQFVGRIGCPT